jgi:hypothetical protein
MPSFATFVIGAASILYVTAILFFSHPGRKTLEGLGVYTECTADVSLLRKSCTLRQKR